MQYGLRQQITRISQERLIMRKQWLLITSKFVYLRTCLLVLILRKMGQWFIGVAVQDHRNFLPKITNTKCENISIEHWKNKQSPTRQQKSKVLIILHLLLTTLP